MFTIHKVLTGPSESLLGFRLSSFTCNGSLHMYLEELELTRAARIPLVTLWLFLRFSASESYHRSYGFLSNDFSVSITMIQELHALLYVW